MSLHSQMSFVTPRTRPASREAFATGWGGGRTSIDIFAHAEHVASKPGLSDAADRRSAGARPGSALGARRTAAPYASDRPHGNERAEGQARTSHRETCFRRNASYEMCEVRVGAHAYHASLLSLGLSYSPMSTSLQTHTRLSGAEGRLKSFLDLDELHRTEV